MIALDASVLIAHLNNTDHLHARARELLVRTARQGVGASPVTLAEVLVAPARAKRLEEARGALASLSIEEIPLAAAAAIRLATLRAETGLKLPDCCVVLAAQEAGGGVATFDDRLARAAVRLGLTVHGADLA